MSSSSSSSSSSAGSTSSSAGSTSSSAGSTSSCSAGSTSSSPGSSSRSAGSTSSSSNGVGSSSSVGSISVGGANRAGRWSRGRSPSRSPSRTATRSMSRSRSRSRSGSPKRRPGRQTIPRHDRWDGGRTHKYRKYEGDLRCVRAGCKMMAGYVSVLHGKEMKLRLCVGCYIAKSRWSPPPFCLSCRKRPVSWKGGNDGFETWEDKCEACRGGGGGASPLAPPLAGSCSFCARPASLPYLGQRQFICDSCRDHERCADCKDGFRQRLFSSSSAVYPSSSSSSSSASSTRRDLCALCAKGRELAAANEELVSVTQESVRMTRDAEERVERCSRHVKDAIDEKRRIQKECADLQRAVSDGRQAQELAAQKHDELQKETLRLQQALVDSRQSHEVAEKRHKELQKQHEEDALVFRSSMAALSNGLVQFRKPAPDERVEALRGEVKSREQQFQQHILAKDQRIAELERAVLEKTSQADAARKSAHPLATTVLRIGKELVAASQEVAALKETRHAHHQQVNGLVKQLSDANQAVAAAQAEAKRFAQLNDAMTAGLVKYKNDNETKQKADNQEADRLRKLVAQLKTKIDADGSSSDKKGVVTRDELAQSKRLAEDELAQTKRAAEQLSQINVAAEEELAQTKRVAEQLSQSKIAAEAEVARLRQLLLAQQEQKHAPAKSEKAHEAALAEIERLRKAHLEQIRASAAEAEGLRQQVRRMADACIQHTQEIATLRQYLGRVLAPKS